MSSLLFGNQSGSDSVATGLGYGSLPFEIARGSNAQFGRPLRQGFGFNPSEHFMNQLATARGPLADVIRSVQGFSGSVGPEAQALGAQTAARGSQAYQTLTGQIDNYLQNLPQYQQEANLGATDATAAVRDAFSPVTSSALYGAASQRMLDQMRPGEAARGLESSGAAQGAEEAGLRDLTFQFAQNQAAQQQQALQGLQGATGFANQMGQQGVGAAQALMQGAGQAQDLQSQQFQLPMQAIGNLLQMLQGGQQQGYQLLGQTSPQLGTTSSSGKDFFGARF
jgi:hypothetical protein